MQNEKINSKEFYEKCSEILNLPHTHIDVVSRRNRWNNRNPGNGRYIGYGIIRFYNEECIHVQFVSKGSRIFSSVEDVYTFLHDINK
mgnify:CR=1 FL=1